MTVGLLTRRLVFFLGIALFAFMPLAGAEEKVDYGTLCIEAYDCAFFDPDTSSGSGSCGASTALTGKGNGEKVFNYFISKGLDNLHAAALAGNIQQESNFNPKADNGQGYHGIIQWGGGRWSKLQKKENHWSLEVQLDFAWEELNGAYKEHFKDFQKDKTIEETTYIIVRHYEVAIKSGSKPNDVQNYSERLAYAKQWLAKSQGSDNTNAKPSTEVTSDQGCVGSSGDCKIAFKDQYSRAQLVKIFGDPGTANNHPEIQKKLTTVDFLGNKVQIHSLAAGCLKDVAADLKTQGTTYKIKQMGCYRFDSDNGSSNIGTKSYHTYGVACDINWDTNPWSGDGSPKPYDMPEAWIKTFKAHGFTWGGDWHSVKDYMHFEYHGITP